MIRAYLCLFPFLNSGSLQKNKYCISVLKLLDQRSLFCTGLRQYFGVLGEMSEKIQQKRDQCAGRTDSDISPESRCRLFLNTCCKLQDLLTSMIDYGKSDEEESPQGALHPIAL